MHFLLTGHMFPIVLVERIYVNTNTFSLDLTSNLLGEICYWSDDLGLKTKGVKPRHWPASNFSLHYYRQLTQLIISEVTIVKKMKSPSFSVTCPS